MDEFEKLLNDSRDFFSSTEEESETVAMIRRDPEAILAGTHKPFMKKLATAVINARTPKEMMESQERRFQASISALETRLQESELVIKTLRSEIDTKGKLVQALEKRLGSELDELIETQHEHTGYVDYFERTNTMFISESKVCVDVRGFLDFKSINEKWSTAFAEYPDPFNTKIPVSLVEAAAMLGIADAQYYLYIVLGQLCVFDRFWHIKVKWLRRAAEQGHVEAIKCMLKELPHVDYNGAVGPMHAVHYQSVLKEKIYWEHVLMEKDAFHEIDFLEVFIENWKRSGFIQHTSYKVSAEDERDHAQWHHIINEEIKHRLKRLMTHYTEGSPGYERCKQNIARLREYVFHHHPEPRIIARFDAI